jgi:hypothetical protein
MKLIAAALALAGTLVLLLGRERRLHHLIGAFLAVVAASLLSSEVGAVTGFAIVLPLILALWAANAPFPPPKPRLPKPGKGELAGRIQQPQARPVASTLGPAPRSEQPRISIEP